MNKHKDPWLDPAPSKTPTLEELHATIALQQIELAQQKQIIALLLLQLSKESASAPQTFAEFAHFGQELSAQALPQNVTDMHEWLDRKYPF
jgi:hypothetical protein